MAPVTTVATTSPLTLPPCPWWAMRTAPMPAKLIWHKESWPAKPTSGTSDSPMMATATIFCRATASGPEAIWAATAPAATNSAAVASEPVHGGRGIDSRVARVLCPRRRPCGRTSSTTNSRITGMAKRNCDSSTPSVGR